MSSSLTRKVLRQFKTLLIVHPLNDKIIELGLRNSDFKDFEDSLQFYSALEFGYNIIITKN
jgi:hypothetical protein